MCTVYSGGVFFVQLIPVMPLWVEQSRAVVVVDAVFGTRR